jgi:hypothetical protein
MGCMEKVYCTYLTGDRKTISLFLKFSLHFHYLYLLNILDLDLLNQNITNSNSSLDDAVLNSLKDYLLFILLSFVVVYNTTSSPNHVRFFGSNNENIICTTTVYLFIYFVNSYF